MQAGYEGCSQHSIRLNQSFNYSAAAAQPLPVWTPSFPGSWHGTRGSGCSADLIPIAPSCWRTRRELVDNMTLRCRKMQCPYSGKTCSRQPSRSCKSNRSARDREAHCAKRSAVCLLKMAERLVTRTGRMQGVRWLALRGDCRRDSTRTPLTFHHPKHTLTGHTDRGGQFEATADHSCGRVC
jgi:hypothetical protein